MSAISNASTLNGWYKSSYSNNGDGACVEVSHGHREEVPVRDSKDPNGPALLFSTEGWSSFVLAIKNGEFALT